MTGFSYGNTGGGNIANTDANYKKVYNAVDLNEALKKGSKVKVIEIMNDLDLGWNEILALRRQCHLAPTILYKHILF